MEKTIVVGDLHLDSRSIPEIENIFKWDIFPVEAHTIIQLGDFYHSSFPNAEELKFGTHLAKQLKKKYKEVIILSGTGDHDLYKSFSVVEYLQEVGVKVVKGDYIKDNYLFGHWMVSDSKFAYGTAAYKTEDLSKYTACFLGHQHTPQVIKPNIFHLGSIRYVSFGEFGEPKGFAILDGTAPEPLYREIKHCIPMHEINLSHAKESGYSIFDTMPIQSKVRVVIDSWELYKETADLLNKVGKKFFEFKIKHEYESPKIEVSTKTVQKSNIIENYLENIQDKEVKVILKEQFKNVNV